MAGCADPVARERTSNDAVFRTCHQGNRNGGDYLVTVPPAATIFSSAEAETLSTVTVSFTLMSP